MLVRKPGSAASLFTIGATEFIGDLENITITAEDRDEDGSGVGDVWEFAYATKQRVQIEADVWVSTTAAMMLKWGTSVVVVANTGGITYTGSFLVSQSVHTVSRDALQKQRVTLKSQGVITLS